MLLGKREIENDPNDQLEVNIFHFRLCYLSIFFCLKLFSDNVLLVSLSTRNLRC